MADACKETIMDKASYLKILHEYQQPVHLDADVLFIVRCGSYECGVVIQLPCGKIAHGDPPKMVLNNPGLSDETVGNFKRLMLGVCAHLGGLMVLSDRIQLDAKGSQYLCYEHSKQTLEEPWSQENKTLWRPHIAISSVGEKKKQIDVDQEQVRTSCGIDWRLVHLLLSGMPTQELGDQMNFLKQSGTLIRQPYYGLGPWMNTSSEKYGYEEAQFGIGVVEGKLLISGCVGVHPKHGYSDAHMAEKYLQTCIKNLKHIHSLDDLLVNVGVTDAGYSKKMEYTKVQRVSMNLWRGASVRFGIGVHKNEGNSIEHWFNPDFEYKTYSSLFKSASLSVDQDIESKKMAQRFRSTYQAHLIEQKLNEHSTTQSSPQRSGEQCSNPKRRML